MNWVVLPRATVSVLLHDPGVRTWIARRLPNETGATFGVGEDPGCIGRLVNLDQETSLLSLWLQDDVEAVSIQNSPLLSIWSAEGEPTVWSTGEEERSELLERLCQLAERSWNRLALPSHWEPKKVEKLPSVFAGDRQLKNIRVAYTVRTVGQRILVDVGTLYYARRNTKPIRVPAIDDARVLRLPMTVLPPERSSPNDFAADGPDLLIEKPAGESRHLFSLKYSEWMDTSGPLTRQQRRVVAHKVQRPLRIHGPAGSGKTLVLILKALRLLREAQTEKNTCHILMVLHSTAMKVTVRAAIEAIDDIGFLATTTKDPHFLDVETLHGWCIRELGLEEGPRYVLETDPVASRQLQRQVLEEVVEEAVESKFPGNRELLSSDFVARIESDRRELVRALEWEISIRIKGRGFRRGDQEAYVKSPARSFVGKGENEYDRYFIFHIYRRYEEHFRDQGLLDTDDIVLGMGARLATSVWDRQRRVRGYDYVMVDEAHLFNENERNVIPYLTRNTTPALPIIMTFDEAQSIGGRRVDGDALRLPESEKRILTSVHRSSPEIFTLARDLVERGPLAFSEFATSEPVARMSERELRRCARPGIVYVDGDEGVQQYVVGLCSDLRSGNYHRVGVVVFGFGLLEGVLSAFSRAELIVHHVRERGEVSAAIPRPGIYVMTPEACGGLEFDAVVLVGVDEGRVPTPIGKLSAEGLLVLEHEAYVELYTAVTRAKYRVVFVCDRQRGASGLLRGPLSAGLLLEES